MNGKAVAARLLDGIGRRAERLLPAPAVMPVLALAQWLNGEPELRRLRHMVPRNRLALDIGAADGIWSWSLQRRARAVIAFEPNPASADRARRRCPGVTLYPVALSNEDGEAELRIPVVNGLLLSGWATIEPKNVHRDLALQATCTIRVPKRRLDSFRLHDVGFIKIDVEGHELAVVEGAVETIRRNSPVILVEVEDRHRPCAVASVRATFKALRYVEMTASAKIQSGNMMLFTPR